jgi:sugar lactone lactonase YvrE
VFWNCSAPPITYRLNSSPATIMTQSSLQLRNRKVFSRLDTDTYGWPDGLCIDAEGGVWSSRWEGGKLIRLDRNGEIDIIIEFPKAWNITCCIFGGENMEDLYVTSASSVTTGGNVQEKPQGGDLFVVKGLGIKGRERFRFRG